MRLRLFAAATAMLVFSIAAHADSFNFSYSGSGIQASGILTTDAGVNGLYTITAISGERNGLTILGLNTTFGGPDELLYYPAANTGDALAPTFLDNNGFSYDTIQASYNVFTSHTRPTVVENDGGPAISFSIAPISAATPEPSSLALLGTGVLGVIGAARRRFIA